MLSFVWDNVSNKPNVLTAWPTFLPLVILTILRVESWGNKIKQKMCFCFWELQRILKRLLKENLDFFHEQFLRWLVASILIGWFVFVLLIIFYPSILALEWKLKKSGTHKNHFQRFNYYFTWIGPYCMELSWFNLSQIEYAGKTIQRL